MRLFKRAVLLFFAVSAFFLSQAQTQKMDTLKVWGNCGMCKKRIENAINSQVISAEWNKDTKQLVVIYDTTKITNKQIQQAIAAAGHDTEQVKAKDKAYQKLPGCCQYERSRSEGPKPQGHQHQGHMHH